MSLPQWPACCLVGAAFFEELSDADYDSYVRKAKDLGLTPYERIALQAGWDGAVDGVDEHVGERTLWVVALNQAEAYQQGRALYEEVKRVA